MPRSTELPETMRAFARCNAVRLTHERFRADTQSLTKALGEALAEADANRRARRKIDAAPGGVWKRFRDWLAALRSRDSWLIPFGFIAVVLLVWRLPTLFFWLYTQGSGELTGLFGLSALVSVAGLVAIPAWVYLRRDSLSGAGFALAWFAASSFLSLLVNSVMIASGTRNPAAAFVPYGLALPAAAIIAALRGRHMTGLEAVVYLIGSVLIANIIVASAMLRSEGAAGV